MFQNDRRFQPLTQQPQNLTGLPVYKVGVNAPALATANYNMNYSAPAKSSDDGLNMSKLAGDLVKTYNAFKTTNTNNQEQTEDNSDHSWDTNNDYIADLYGFNNFIQPEKSNNFVDKLLGNGVLGNIVGLFR